MHAITDLTPEGIADLLRPHGFPEDKVRRLYAYAVKGGGATGGDPELAWAARGLSKAERALLGRLLHRPALTVVERRRAADGFVKYLFRTAPEPGAGDGHLIEAVRIPLFDTKYVVCVSSQAGCQLQCAFCATGRMGLARSLHAWEIVEQVRVIRAEADRPVRGVVFMGMGEPFLNYDAVIRAADIMSHPLGLSIAKKAISISTAGVVPAIRRYTAEGHKYRLAISLTAAQTEKRRSLMPIEKKWPVTELIAAAREHHARHGGRITLEYVAIAGKNCTPADAAALHELLHGLPVRLNLIEVNDATGEFHPPGAAELAAFRDALQVLHQPIVRRYSGGKEVHAACGMLAAVSCDGVGDILGGS